MKNKWFIKTWFVITTEPKFATFDNLKRDPVWWNDMSLHEPDKQLVTKNNGHVISMVPSAVKDLDFLRGGLL